MSLVKRNHGDVELSDRLLGRRLFDWPETWRDLFDVAAPEMRVEEYQEDGHLVVKAEMPGLDPDKDVEITVQDHMLHITAERRQETRSEDKAGYRSEFRYGSFSRTIALPLGATEEDVEASYRDGILEVRVPVDAEQAAAKKVPVTHG